MAFDKAKAKLTVPGPERCCSGAEWVDISKSSAYEM